MTSRLRWSRVGLTLGQVDSCLARLFLRGMEDQHVVLKDRGGALHRQSHLRQVLYVWEKGWTQTGSGQSPGWQSEQQGSGWKLH